MRTSKYRRELRQAESGKPAGLERYVAMNSTAHQRPAAAVFPQSTELSVDTKRDLDRVASELNTRSIMTLSFCPPP
jgi:hypothetical protein